MPSSAALPPHIGFPTDALDHACPACGTPGPRALYSVRGVPTQSCVLIDGREEARAFPHGDVELAACEHCGLLFNAAFDPERIDYREGYEETQGHSKTFSSWLETVAHGLVDDHGVRNATVVEIGCGKGEFLEQVCHAGDNRGIGIDPSVTSGRVAKGTGRGLEFLREEYGAQHASLGPDAIVCRHTLEHLPDVGAFARLLRSNLEGLDALVLVEVPDVGRVLDEGAFWDVYYEHCSYFTQGSLARLFRSSGFALLELGAHYGDQYLQVLARPLTADATPSRSFAGESDLERTRLSARAFQESCRRSLSHWHGVLGEARGRGERVVLWGSGSKATGLLTTLAIDAEPGNVEHVVDINPDKHGKFVAGTGQEIIAPADLGQLAPDLVLVMNPVYQSEIARDLAKMGIEARVMVL